MPCGLKGGRIWCSGLVKSTLLLFAATLITCSAEAATVIYVDDDAPNGGNGTTWQTAYKCLQDALAVATSGYEIRVAGGIYLPDRDESGDVTRGDREATFQIVSGTSLRGGYLGLSKPGNSDERDLNRYPTVLSGDLLGDDDSGGDNSENSYHVLTANGTDATTTLEGLTITAGNADVPEHDVHDGGGGLRMVGGGLTLTDCTFTKNTAQEFGGGIYCDNGNPVLVKCVFNRNFTLTDPFPHGGAGIMCRNASNPVLNGCLFVDNTAQGANGGGMHNRENTNATITNCVFIANSTCVGGGLFNDTSTSTLTNCTFYGNWARAAGGLYSYDSTETVNNCVFWANYQFQGTAGADQIDVTSALSIDINHSCVQGWNGYLGGVGNIGDDPMFIDPDGTDDVPGTEDDNLRLPAMSPCRNAGDPDYSPEAGAIDFDGHARVLCGRVDMGAYEAGIGDYDCDQVVGPADFENWPACMVQPYGQQCEAFDLDYDADVDLRDFAGFQRAFEGVSP